MLPHGDEYASFLQSIPYSTQDLPIASSADLAAQIPPNMHMDTGFNNNGAFVYEGIWASMDPHASIDYAAFAPQAAPPAPVCGGGHAAAAGSSTGIQHLDPRWLDSWTSRVEQQLLSEVEAPDNGYPSCRDVDMPEVNEAAPQPDPGPLPVAVPVQGELSSCRGLGFFKSAVKQDLFPRFFSSEDDLFGPDNMVMPNLRFGINSSNAPRLLQQGSVVALTSIVHFTGPDSKGRKPHQGGWKEKSMTGMRAVADPSSPQPLGQEQQRYVGLKKTLELDDDGSGNKWCAHEYTPLLPSDDGTNKLVATPFSLRVEFKQDQPPSSASSTKRSRNADGRSAVWEHMTKVHVEVATNADGSQRKNPCYKVMFAICQHCDKVFNAGSDHHGTNNLNKHLVKCSDCRCTHSNALAAGLSHSVGSYW